MKTPRRVLIVQPYGIGDLLFLTPVLRALRLIPTVEKVDLLLGSRTDAVVRRNPHIDRIYSIDKDKVHGQDFFKNAREFWALGRELAANRYDLLLDYSLRGEYAFFSQWVLGIQRRAGFAYKNRGFFHNLKVPLPEGFAGRHAVDSVCAVAEKAGIRVRDRFLEFYIQPEDREAAAHLLKETTGSSDSRYAVVSPGGGESWGKDAYFKRWPVSFFAEFINQLRQKTAFENLMIIGSGKEADLGDELVRGVSCPAVNLCGKISLETSAALIERAEIFIGNDGGLVHLASALQRPIIAFYGPVAPEVYGPYPPSLHAAPVYKKDLACRPCYRKFRYKSDCAGRECLQDLTPGEAIAFLEADGFFPALAHAQP